MRGYARPEFALSRVWAGQELRCLLAAQAGLLQALTPSPLQEQQHLRQSEQSCNSPGVMP